MKISDSVEISHVFDFQMVKVLLSCFLKHVTLLSLQGRASLPENSNPRYFSLLISRASDRFGLIFQLSFGPVLIWPQCLCLCQRYFSQKDASLSICAKGMGLLISFAFIDPAGCPSYKTTINVEFSSLNIEAALTSIHPHIHRCFPPAPQSKPLTRHPA